MNAYMDKDHSLIPTSQGAILRNGRHPSQDGVSVLNSNVSNVPEVHKLTHCSSHPTEVLGLCMAEEGRYGKGLRTHFWRHFFLYID